MKITISKGNIKLGKLPNISLPPVISCGKLPCNKDCYALKAYRLYPDVKKAYLKNWKIYKSNPKEYFSLIETYLRKNKPKFFRWHTSGDIPDTKYLEYMRLLAIMFPETKFLCFTKKYHFNYSKLPSNLTIILSAWPNLPLPKKRLPIAFMQDGTETRVKNAIECPGNCENCGMCWHLPELNKNVVFNKH